VSASTVTRGAGFDHQVLITLSAGSSGGQLHQWQERTPLNSSVRCAQVDGITSEPRTTLKYAIEVALPRTTRLLGVLEPFLERVVYEVRI